MEAYGIHCIEYFECHQAYIAGMKESEKIIAIDHNNKASIFHYADFGIVGEYEDILPELIERVKNGFTFGMEPVRN